MRLKLIIILSINILFSQDALSNKKSDDIETLSEEIKTLTQGVDETTSSIEENISTVEINVNDIEKINKEIKSIQIEIDKLSPKISESDKVNKLEFEDIKSKLSDLEDKIETLSKTNSQIEDKLKNIDNSIDLKVNQSTFDKQKSIIENSIDAHYNILDSLIKELKIDDDEKGFQEAFLSNRLKGKKKFTWKGKPYNTDYEGEISSRHKLLFSFEQQRDTLELLKNQFKNKIDDVENIIAQLNIKLEEANEGINTSNLKIDDVKDTLNSNAIYIIIALLLIIIGLIGSYLYFNTKFGSHSDSLESMERSNKKRDETLESISKNQIEIDGKLLTVLEGMVNKISKEPQSQTVEPNHSLAITVCDEVQRMRNRLKIMRSKEEHDEQGVKVITKRLESLEEELNKNGYEIVDDSGKPYDSGMKVEASFVEDDTLEKGKEIITRVIKPGIKFNRKQIRHAQIQVNKGTKAE